MSKTTLENNKKKVISEFDERINTSLYAMGMLWLSNVTDVITSKYSSFRGGSGIVDTGRLRASQSFITPDASGGNDKVKESKSNDKLKGKASSETLTVGTNVDYATHIELGTKYMKGRPFLKTSLLDYKNDYKKIFEDTMKK